AIIDEASQLTIPAILGALRFAKRFILVGDEKQLPPLVLSKEAAKQKLDRSLFLYLKEHPEAEDACVSLEIQYRMNQCISHFASQVFYKGALKAAPDVANRILELPRQSVSEATWLIRAIQPSRPFFRIDASQ